MKKATEELVWVNKREHLEMLEELELARNTVKTLKVKNRQLKTRLCSERSQAKLNSEQLEQLESSHALLNQLKLSLLKRDKVIQDLRQRVSEVVDIPIGDHVSKLAQAAKLTPHAKLLFKEHIGCTHVLNQAFSSHSGTAQVLLKVCEFATQLLFTQSIPTSVSIETFASQSPPKPELKTSKKKASAPRQRASMGPSGSFVVPILWKEDGWTPKEMFKHEHQA